jgi:hypothetical protein
MKNIILFIGVIFSLNAFATDYKCISEKGKIYISESSREVKVTFTDHIVVKEDYFTLSFNALTFLGSRSEWKEDLTGQIFSVTLKPEEIIRGSGLSYKNTASKLVAISKGSQDISFYKVRFSFNKRKLEARIQYKVSVVDHVYRRLSDRLTCMMIQN